MWVDTGSTDTARRRVAGNRGVVVTRASFMTSSVMRLSLLLVYVAVVSVAANVTDARDQRQTGTQQTPNTVQVYTGGGPYKASLSRDREYQSDSDDL